MTRRASHHDGAVAVVSVAAYCVLTARFAREPGPRERRLFTALNDGPHGPWLRVPQQLGTPWALPVASAVLLARGRRADALAAVAALPLVKGLEVATKKAWDRPRPLMVTPTALRDDAPVEGPSQPSGHTAIAAAATYLVAPAVPPAVAGGLAAATAAASYVRVNQGAHWPSDVVTGTFLGLGVAAGLRWGVARLLS
ncbi:phosphatase PAP2 family protein [Aeromicrobium massiliense]|uniref:phosphatase PAP2 family protein n=1 Tax=Aeromicrobium massiliense TaxID=1464554 RepID=UPI0009DA26E9|nr:phosphatase PAP2 family protein [Aeromicrobium massiliense]